MFKFTLDIILGLILGWNLDEDISKAPEGPINEILEVFS